MRLTRSIQLRGVQLHRLHGRVIGHELHEVSLCDLDKIVGQQIFQRHPGMSNPQRARVVALLELQLQLPDGRIYPLPESDCCSLRSVTQGESSLQEPFQCKLWQV